MGMQVNTNIAANNAYRNLATTQNDLSKSLEKLSSGLRINRAADDAAGLAISEGLKSQVGGLTVASRNAQDAVSVIQTAEGSLNEVQSILQRVRDLAVQAGNDSNSIQSREAITTEVNALREELTRISDSTNFNGTKLLNGEPTSLSFQVGANGEGSSQIKVNLADVGNVTNALNGKDSAGADLKGAVNVSGVAIAATTLGADTSYVIEQAGGGATSTVTFVAGTYSNEQILQGLQDQAGANFEVSGNAGSYTFVSKNTDLTDGSTAGISISTGGSPLTGTTSGNEVGPGALSFTSAEDAATAITTIDRQISAISTARASLGADQNRFESVIKNIAVSKENLTAAGSRIRDTDMAEEMVKYTRANILSQAGTAMLAQANQSNSGVLQLLG